MALKLKQVSIRNWQTVRESSLTFPDRGLVLVLGQNFAAKGRMKSVGSGKTALGESISRAVLGIRGRFEHAGTYSCDQAGSKNMLVQVDLEGDGHRLTVQSGYKCKELSRTGEGLRFTIDGDEIERGKITSTREELTAVLGVDPTLARHTLYVDGDLLKFNRLSQRELVDLVMGALGQAQWDGRRRKVRELANSYRTKQAALESNINSLTRQKELIAQDLEYAKKELKEANEDYEQDIADQKRLVKEKQEEISALSKKLTTRQTRLKEIKAEIKKIEERSAKELHALEIKLNDLQENQSKAEEAYVKAMRAFTQSTSDKTALRKRIRDLKEGTACPTCRRPFDDKVAEIKEELARLEKKFSLLEETYGELELDERRARDTKDKVQRDVNTAQSEFNALAKKNDIGSLSDEYETLETKANSMEEDLNELKLDLADLKKPPDKSAVTAAQAVVNERAKTLKKATADLETFIEERAKHQRIVSVIEYWEHAFSPVGIPNLILRDGLGVLNHTCARLSQELTGGTIDLKYKTTREMRSGDERPELTVEVSNAIGSSRVDGGSKGESGLTNLILAESLLEVSHVTDKIGFRWLDEVVNNQDMVVRQTIYQYLRDQAHEKGILIFVVDHHGDVRDHADYTLVATKDSQGRTTYNWT